MMCPSVIFLSILFLWGLLSLLYLQFAVFQRTRNLTLFLQILFPALFFSLLSLCDSYNTQSTIWYCPKCNWVDIYFYSLFSLCPADWIIFIDCSSSLFKLFLHQQCAVSSPGKFLLQIYFSVLEFTFESSLKICFQL